MRNSNCDDARDVIPKVNESVVVIPEPSEGEDDATADPAAGGKKDKGGKKGKDKKKGKGGDEPPLPRRDLPAVVTCVGSVVLKLPQFLEGADAVEKTLVLLDEGGKEVVKTLPPAPADAEDEAAEESARENDGPKEALPPLTVPTTLSVAISLPRVTERAAGVQETVKQEAEAAAAAAAAAAAGEAGADVSDRGGGAGTANVEPESGNVGMGKGGGGDGTTKEAAGSNVSGAGGDTVAA